MKTEYRIVEKKYESGLTLFFPQIFCDKNCGDNYETITDWFPLNDSKVGQFSIDSAKELIKNYRDRNSKIFEEIINKIE